MRIIIDNADQNDVNELAKLARAGKINTFRVACDEKPKGEWVFKKFDEETGISNSDWCPFCGTVKTQVYDNFCGYCGADMRKAVQNDRI